MFFVVKRATLLIASGPASDPNKKHLFICLTDVVGTSKETLMVSASTHRAGFPADDTCHLLLAIIRSSSIRVISITKTRELLRRISW